MCGGCESSGKYCAPFKWHSIMSVSIGHLPARTHPDDDDDRRQQHHEAAFRLTLHTHLKTPNSLILTRTDFRLFQAQFKERSGRRRVRPERRRFLQRHHTAAVLAVSYTASRTVAVSGVAAVPTPCGMRAAISRGRTVETTIGSVTATARGDRDCELTPDASLPGCRHFKSIRSI